jgi:predicted unusual protein kinase regulating ubiquinone biosynthesis (AarF/ABC1/UbiB family)
MSRKDEENGGGLPAHLRALIGEDADLAAEVERALARRIEKLSTGRLGRAFKISKLAIGSGGKLAMGKARELLGRSSGGEIISKDDAVELAVDMLGAFSELRGLAMKLGQMISYVDHNLPPEARKILAVLQRDAPPMPFDIVRQRLSDELRRPIESVFETIDERPLAAASIGQVHRARLRGGVEVAVKIQYPGIDKAMSADLKNAKVMSLFKQALFVKTDIKAIMAELEERLLDECNYLKEAEYQRAFRRRFEGHPAIVVPKVFEEVSTERVLVTELESGKTFYEWLKTNPSPEERRRVTRVFYRFYLGSFYLDGLFNCDPHPGNYLFRDDGKIVFLDYGCSRRFSEERRQIWIEMAKAVRKDEERSLHEIGVGVGFLAPDTKYDYAAFRELMRYLYEPYIEDLDYEFARHKPQKTFRSMFVDNPNLFRLNMPADAVFLNRITFGLVSLLTEIGAPLNCYRLADEYFARRDPDWPDDPFLRGAAA